MSGYEAFSIPSRFSAKGRSRAREASRKCGNRLFWAHPGTGATSTPEQWETPLSCPLLRPGAMPPTSVSSYTQTSASWCVLSVACHHREDHTKPHPCEQEGVTCHQGQSSQGVSVLG